MQVRIEPVANTALDEVANFVAVRNADDAQHIGYLGTDADDILADLKDLYDGALIALAYDRAELVGVLIAEWDVQLGRTWLYGPWGSGTDRLYAALRPHLPAAAPEHELYCAATNEGVVKFAQRHEFIAHGHSVLYEISREELASVPPESLPTLTPDLDEEFAALHRRVFPGSAYDADALAARVPPALVAVRDGRLIGYAVLRVTPESATAELDYLAVSEVARGQGIGQRLAAGAVRQAFDIPHLRTVVLDTNAGNIAAQRVYESVGFRRDRAMRSFRTG